MNLVFEVNKRLAFACSLNCTLSAMKCDFKRARQASTACGKSAFETASQVWLRPFVNR